VIDMTSEQVLAKVVREWANQELPGEPGAADRAAGLAAACYADNASITQACAEARGFVGSWIRHPAHAKVGRGLNLKLVS
jgi:hypothetical protein